LDLLRRQQLIKDAIAQCACRLLDALPTLRRKHRDIAVLRAQRHCERLRKLRHETCIAIRFRATQSVMHVNRGDHDACLRPRGSHRRQQRYGIRAS
jgi:hypothetical protein